MSALQEVPFGLLQSNSADVQVPLDRAIRMADCITDAQQIETRPGYRVCVNTAFTGTTAQELYRFRPSRTSAKTIAVTGGAISTLTDPTSETASDSVIALLSTPFTATAITPAAQLNSNCYIGTDDADTAWVRVKSDYSIQTLTSIRQGAVPTLSAFSALSFTLFKNVQSDNPTITGTAVIQTSASTGMSGLQSDWRAFTKTNNGNDNPLTGVTVQYKLTADYDSRACDWLVIAITPYDSNNQTGQVDVYLANDSAGSPVNLTLVGGTYDPVQGYGGSPNLLFVPLSGLPSAVRSAVRYIKFNLSGSSGGKFGIYGYLFLPAMPVTNPQLYYVDFYDSVNVQASPLTTALSVAITPSDVILPTYPNCYLDNHNFTNTGGSDGLFSTGNYRVFNREAAKPMPALADIGAIVTLTGTSPSGYTGTLVPRMWKDTTTGRRLVTTTTAIATGVAYSLTDNGGLITVSNTLYKPGGPPPRTAALAASAGRLIAGYENRLYISSYIPTSDNTNPVPVFPDVPTLSSDGWSFDFISKAESIQCIIGEDRGADATYVMTQMNTRYIKELDAPLFGTPPIFLIINRGALGPHAAIYAEGRLFIASYDGVYVASGRKFEGELTAPIRDLYIESLVPQYNVCLGYSIAERALYVIQDTIALRCSFLHGEPEWSGPHTLNDHIAVMCGWMDPTSSSSTLAYPQLWMLTTGRKVGRMQAAASRDMMVGTSTSLGAAKPDWSFSTGFEMAPQQSRVSRLYADIDGGEAEIYTAATMEREDERRHTMPEGETTSEGPADMKSYKWRLRITGSPSTIVRRVMWERQGLDAVR